MKITMKIKSVNMVVPMWRRMPLAGMVAALALSPVFGEDVTVWRDGREALVRSRFSATDDLVVHV